MSVTLELFEYATDAAAQAAYVSSDVAGTTVTSETQADGAYYGAYGGLNADGMGIRFKVAQAGTITSFVHKLYQAASATGTYNAYIYNSSGTIPTTLAATFSTIDVSTITTNTAGVEYTFTGSFTPVVDTFYFCVLIASAGYAGQVYHIKNTTVQTNGYMNRHYSDNGWTGGGIGECGYFKVTQATPNLQCYSEATIKTQGSYSLKGIAVITNSLNDTLTSTVSPTIDLTGQTQIKYGIYGGRTGSNIKIGIHDSGGTTTEHTANISSADAWETQTWDISAISDANKDAIDQIIVTIVNADAANTFYIDNMFAQTPTTFIPKIIII